MSRCWNGSVRQLSVGRSDPHSIQNIACDTNTFGQASVVRVQRDWVWHVGRLWSHTWHIVRETIWSVPSTTGACSYRIRYVIILSLETVLHILCLMSRILRLFWFHRNKIMRASTQIAGNLCLVSWRTLVELYCITRITSPKRTLNKASTQIVENHVIH